MLYRYQPNDVGDEELCALFWEYSELCAAISAMSTQTHEWWSDDADGIKQQTWEDMHRTRTSLLSTFPFLIHCPTVMQRWEH